MRITIKFLLLIIVGFTLVSGSFEVYRLVNTNLLVKENIRTIALDAIEIALIDQYYKEGIHVLDEEMLVENLEKMIMKQFNLDRAFRPLDDEQLYGAFEINLEYDLGNYIKSHHDETYMQGNMPFLKVTGETSTKPVVLHYKEEMFIRFEIIVTTENLFNTNEYNSN